MAHNVCANCFKYLEHKYLFQDDNLKTGKCSYCSSPDMSVMDLDDEMQTLVESLKADFGDVFSYYVKDEKGRPLLEVFLDDWQVFDTNFLQAQVSQESLLTSLLNETVDSSVKVELDPKVRDQERNKIISDGSWNDFTQVLLRKNRFQSNKFDVRHFRRYMDVLTKIIENDDDMKFFRGRTVESSVDKPLPDSEMGLPPWDVVREGRLNSIGIPVLYLASNLDTVPGELRGDVHQKFSISTFKLTDDIKIVDFTMLSQISPFGPAFAESKIEWYWNKNDLIEMARDFSAPVKDLDGRANGTEYLPTQFLADAIKSMEMDFDGIKYASTVNDQAYNLALFKDDKVEIVQTELMTVESVAYQLKEFNASEI
ncbi:hypothetical protein EFL41_01830 [Weissella cibaria]|uniref:RES domain-containing protein n=1 Tax=Weissella cibaria TaxID=137591 RepID=UPI00223B31B1|nr:RES domain-containing protein [Weissella cibaria]MCT0952313.1 hypothetical protein [Weissella cibaria]